MSGADFAFFALAITALAAALVAALAVDRRRATIALLVAAGAEAAIACLLGAWAIATAEAAVLVAGFALLRRTAGSPAAETVDGRQPERVAEANTSEPEPEHGIPVAIPARWRPALLVAAFVALVARAVLMVRWPNVASGAAGAAAGTAAWITSIGTAHHLLAQLLVFAAGWYAAATRRRFDGIATGAATMLLATVSAIAAAGRFTGSTAEASVLGVLVVAAAAGTALFWNASVAGLSEGWSSSRVDADAGEAGEVSSGLVAALAGCALALLVGAW